MKHNLIPADICRLLLVMLFRFTTKFDPQGYCITLTTSPQVDLRRGDFRFREAHIKNPDNKTVPEGVMQGLTYHRL